MKLTLLTLAALLLAAPAAAAEPSFDCVKAASSAEKLVCADTQLAALDREMARLYTLAHDGPHMTASARQDLVAFQRGWVKGRDDCWKADNLRRCVLDSYVERIAELRAGYADARAADDQGNSLGPFEVTCDGIEAGIAATFVNTDPSLLLLRWRDTSVILNQAISGSGARYVGTEDSSTYEFWIKGDEVRFTRPGQAAAQCLIAEVED